MLPAADFLSFLLPTLALVLGALACLVAEPLLADRNKHVVLPWVAMATLLAGAVALRSTFPGHLHGMFAIDPVRAGLILVLLAVAAIGVAAMQQNLSQDRFPGGEPYVLLLLATIGLQGMILATNSIALFVSMELASLAIYPLVGLRRNSVLSSEAILKYFAMGSVFSAIFLYGAALSYGALGTTSLVGTIQPGRDGIHHLGFALMALGLLFKASAAPFHFWSPDAYSGAPSAVTGFMAASVKLGAFAALGGLWVDYLAVQANAAPMSPLALAVYVPPEILGWLPPNIVARVNTVAFALGGIGLLSVLVGSLGLLGQTSIRRLMAFSGVTNAGFLTLSLLLPSVFRGHVQLSVLWYYLATYALASMGLLACLTALAGSEDEGDHLSQLAGAARKHPLVGAALTVFIASLAGLPPAAGFVAKFQALTGLMLSVASPKQIFIPAGAMLLAVVAAAGYLRLLILIWSNPGVGSDKTRQPGVLLGWAVSLTALALLVLAVFPEKILFHP